MARQRLVWDREAHRFVPRREFYAKRRPEQRSHLPAPRVMGDIEGYRSVIDGSVIGSRSAHRDHLRENGCIEVGNEPLSPPLPYEPQGVAQDIADTYTALENGAQAAEPEYGDIIPDDD